MQLCMGVNGRNVAPAPTFLIFSLLYVLKEKQKETNQTNNEQQFETPSLARQDWAITVYQAIKNTQEMRAPAAASEPSISKALLARSA